MNVKRFIGFCMLLGVVAVAGRAQSVHVQAKIDSSEIFIGEQVDIVLSVSSEAGADVSLPSCVGMELTPRVEVLRETKDSVVPNVDNPARKQTLKRYTVTSFDSSFYYLPPFQVMVDGKQYETNSLPLKVETVEIDTLHLDQFFGPKEIAQPPFKWSDWSGLVWQSICLCVLLCVLLYLYIRMRTNHRLLPRLQLRAAQPPHVWAREEIEKLNHQPELQNDAKTYYTRLTDILRTYIRRRYDFDATQMTSEEIIENLRAKMTASDEQSVRAGDELRALLEVADLAKFARLQTRLDEDASNLLKALSFVDITRQSEEELKKPTKPQPSPEIVRSDRARLALMMVMIVIGVAIVVLAFFVGRSLYQILFVG